MEVLVRSLKISYEDFIDITVDGKPLWGLLYDEEDKNNQTVLYRTRNEIVTKVLLELVNGGVGHAGEFRILKTLLSSCDIGSAIYREFAIEVLVRTSKEIEKYLSYEQGLELFDVAENVLPHEDRLLAHHKGIWMQRVGKEYQEAYAQFEKSLELQQYPGDRMVYVEHIHTSMAASVVGLVKDSKQNPSKGLQLVQDHLQQASNPKIFNAYTGHVFANLLFQMAQQHGSDTTNEVNIESYSGALKEVEKTIQSIGPSWRKNPKHNKSVELLTELQGQIINSIPDDASLEDYAYNSFDETQNQMGFELLLRKMFTKAQIKDKGKEYNKVNEQISSIIDHVKDSDIKPTVEIYSIRTDLVIRWRLQRANGEVPWEGFKNDLQIIVDDPKYRYSPIKNFYLAVALFHLENIEQSNAIFASLRRIQATGLIPKKVRCFFVGKEGHPKRFQCTISRSNGRSYANIPELNTDLLAATFGQQTSSHVFISFSLNGPLARYDRPDENQMLLA